MKKINTILDTLGFTYKKVFHFSYYGMWICIIRIYYKNFCILDIRTTDKNREESEKKCYKKTIEHLLTFLNKNALINDEYAEFCYCSLEETDDWKDELIKAKCLEELSRSGLTDFVKLSDEYHNECCEKAKEMSQKITLYKRMVENRYVVLAIIHLGMGQPVIGGLNVNKNLNVAINETIGLILSEDYVITETISSIKPLRYITSIKKSNPFFVTTKILLQKENLDNIDIDYSTLSIEKKKIADIDYYCYKIKDNKNTQALLNFKNRILNSKNLESYLEEWYKCIDCDSINIQESNKLLSLFNMDTTVKEIEKNILRPLINDPEYIYIIDCDVYTEQIKKYQFLNSYLLSNKYDNEEIMKIAKNLNIEITLDNIKNSFKKDYLISEIFYKTFFNIYNSADYKNIINQISSRGGA